MFNRNDNTTATTADELNEMGKDAKSSTAKIEESLRRGREEARETIHDVKEDLEYAARRAGRHARRIADTASHNIEDFGATMTYKVRKEPLKHVAYAAGVGILIGLLVGRR